MKLILNRVNNLSILPIAVFVYMVIYSLLTRRLPIDIADYNFAFGFAVFTIVLIAHLFSPQRKSSPYLLGFGILLFFITVSRLAFVNEIIIHRQTQSFTLPYFVSFTWILATYPFMLLYHLLVFLTFRRLTLSP